MMRFAVAVKRARWSYGLGMTASLEPLSPRESETQMTEQVLPQHANVLGTAFGGTIMGWIDICAAIAAQRHCGRTPVTVFVDDLHFKVPIRVGDVVCVHGRLTQAFGSSMEVCVRVTRERPGCRDQVLSVEALLVFVNVGEDGKAMPVPRLLLETDEDRRLAADADARRAARKLARS